MKEKKHIPPIQVLGSIFLLGGWSAMYLKNALTFGSDTIDTWISIIISIIVIVMMITGIVFYITVLCNKTFRKGNEFTTKNLQKAAYGAFVAIIGLSALLFTCLQIIMLNHKENGVTSKEINDIFDLKVILGAIVGIQLIGTFLFTMLYFVNSKKGNVEDIS